MVEMYDDAKGGNTVMLHLFILNVVAKCIGEKKLRDNRLWASIATQRYRE